MRGDVLGWSDLVETLLYLILQENEIGRMVLAHVLTPSEIVMI